MAGAANGAAQTAAAGFNTFAEKEIDAAAFAFQTATQKQDNALTYQQALDAKQDLLREEQGSIAEAQELISARAQAISRRTALFSELVRIRSTLVTNTSNLRAKSYANPIHYIRAENAIIEADSRFLEAQRWLFLTQRALEHKWAQRFAIVSGTKSYDAGSLFKMRNANELNDFLTALVEFNGNRETLFGPPNTTPRYTVISLKDDVLTPNPKRFNLTDIEEDFIRVDLSTGETVSQQELFAGNWNEPKTEPMVFGKTQYGPAQP